MLGGDAGNMLGGDAGLEDDNFPIGRLPFLHYMSQKQNSEFINTSAFLSYSHSFWEV